MPGRRVILIEFNELSPTLLERFMAEGRLPNFERFHDASDTYVTDAGERGETLMPWIAWPSIHSGLPYSEHHAFRLGQGRAVAAPEIASILSSAGFPVGVFGSMNTNYGTWMRGYFVPDPWDAKGMPSPSSLRPYADAIARLVQENSRARVPSFAASGRLGAFLLTHGLRLKTAVALARQLLAEAFDREVSWRRASLLDRIQYDVFRELNKRYDVAFATFFSNSTAHYQHHYWRNFEPGAFAEPPDPSEHPSLANAILFGYESMDRLLGEFVRDYPDALLILATGHSQEADKTRAYRYFRPRDFNALLAFAEVRGGTIEPVMSEQFFVRFADESLAREAQAKLAELILDDGLATLAIEREGSSLFVGCRHLYDDVCEKGSVRSAGGKRSPYGKLFYRVPVRRSGVHHPDGALWIRSGRRSVQRERCSILDIAPTLLEHFGVPIPAYMRGRVLRSASPEWVEQSPELVFSAQDSMRR